MCQTDIGCLTEGKWKKKIFFRLKIIATVEISAEVRFLKSAAGTDYWSINVFCI